MRESVNEERARGSWRPLGAVPPAELIEARLQLHWAAQVPASVGYGLVHPQPEFAHLSLEWLDGPELLVTQPTELGYRAALRPRDLTLGVVMGGDPVTEYPLVGQTTASALEWLRSVLWGLGELPGDKTLALPDHELPDHPVRDGAPFAGAPADALGELRNGYADAARVLGELAAETPGAAPVRCWPHHFDVATLIVLDPELDSEEARSIGLGMSPGDSPGGGSYPEPYWYVTPWPYADSPTLPTLTRGAHWHTEGWLGAVLPTSQLRDTPDQEGVVRAFLTEAMAAARSTLDESA